jgi:lipoate-protein ligase A
VTSATLTEAPRTTASWRLLTTPAMSGEENMAYDRQTLLKVQDPAQPAVLRFFRWSRPAVSYGRHQSLEAIQALVPSGWDAVQRPTGGGLVFHKEGLCLSLCWRAGQPPLPERLKDHYAWIHGVIATALNTDISPRLANCRDCVAPSEFSTRDCFTQPVAFDILAQDKKIVGGALCRQKNAFLYQGAIQAALDPSLESHLRTAFERALALK